MPARAERAAGGGQVGPVLAVGHDVGHVAGERVDPVAAHAPAGRSGHLHVGDAVPEELVALGHEPELAVPAGQPGLGLEHDRVRRLRARASRMSRTPRRWSRTSSRVTTRPISDRPVGLGAGSGRSRRTVPSRSSQRWRHDGLAVAAVEVAEHAVLLDHEHVHPQAEDLVQRRRVELVERGLPQDQVVGVDGARRYRSAPAGTDGGSPAGDLGPSLDRMVKLRGRWAPCAPRATASRSSTRPSATPRTRPCCW